MPSKFHDEEVSRISPKERALMVKSLEIISQVHSILDQRGITQKALADMLKISPAAVSQMLIPGGNLELNTVVRLENILCETILTTPDKVAALLEQKKSPEWNWVREKQKVEPYSPLRVSYVSSEPKSFDINIEIKNFKKHG
ncbi:MAG: helix-turn-helix domain-containing protein [Bacteroidetes bacterium]|nr:helix-turn-helix domain-containing protein [Bacteroidota bacterium]